MNRRCVCSRTSRSPLPKSGYQTAWSLLPSLQNHKACRVHLRAAAHHVPLGTGSRDSAGFCFLCNSFSLLTFGLWLRQSPTPCGFQIKICEHIFAWKPWLCFTWNVSEVSAAKNTLVFFIAEPKQVGSEGANIDCVAI